MSLSYVEHAPGVGLADAIRCYWTICGRIDEADVPVRNRVLPDNCIDVIFDLREGATAAFVVGPMLAAELLHYRDADLLGVRFRPGAATEFLGVRASDLLPRDVNAADIWRDAPELTERLLASAPASRLALLDTYLLGRRHAVREAGIARRASAAIERSHGLLSVRTLTNALGVTERTLQRAFDAAVGIGPKQALRVQRFRAAAAAVTRGAAGSLSRIAAMCGYSDQAHMTRDFVSLGGATPTELRDEQRLVREVKD